MDDTRDAGFVAQRGAQPLGIDSAVDTTGRTSYERTEDWRPPNTSTPIDGKVMWRSDTMGWETPYGQFVLAARMPTDSCWTRLVQDNWKRADQ